MMTEQHPITPPPELVQQWWDGTHGAYYELEAVATQAARWGADTELEACCEYMQNEDFHGFAKELRAARRPKPPSLKEKGLTSLAKLEEQGLCPDLVNEIRQVLEQLND